jgi:hypothetical protein
MGGRASPYLHFKPSTIGAGATNVNVIAYRTLNPYRLTGTPAYISDSVNVCPVGEDAIILLPGRGVNLGVSPIVYGPASKFTPGANVYIHPDTGMTQLDRKHGMQLHLPARRAHIEGGEIGFSQDYSGVIDQSKANRAIYILDTIEELYIEGIRFPGGDFQFEVCNLHTAHSCKVIFQNWYGKAAIDSSGKMMGVRYIPLDIAGAGNHIGGDWIQFETTPDYFGMDGMHSEYNTFQEYFMQVESGQIVPSTIWADNIVAYKYGGPGGFWKIDDDDGGHYTPNILMGNNISMQPDLMYHPNADFSAAIQYPSTYTSLANNIWPKTGQVVGVDGLGRQYLQNDLYKRLDGSGVGKVYSIPTGDSIDINKALAIASPGQLPGVNYESPGYADDHGTGGITVATKTVTDNERDFYINVLGLDPGINMSINDLRAAYYANPPASGSSFDASLPQSITGAWTFVTRPTIPDASSAQNPASKAQLDALSAQINGAWDAVLSADYTFLGAATSTVLEDVVGLLISVPADSLKDRYLAFNLNLKYTADQTGDLKIGLTATGAGVEYFFGNSNLAAGATAVTGTARTDTVDNQGDTFASTIQLPGQNATVLSTLAQGEMFIPKTIAATFQIQFAPSAGAGTIKPVIKRLSALHMAVYKLV